MIRSSGRVWAVSTGKMDRSSQVTGTTIWRTEKAGSSMQKAVCIKASGKMIWLTAMVSIPPLLELATVANGTAIKNTASELRTLWTAVGTKAYSSTVSNKVKAPSNSKMALFSTVRSRWANSTDTEFMFGRMAVAMQEFGLRTACTAKANSLGQIRESTSGIIERTRSKVTGKLPGLTVAITKVSGVTDDSTAKVNTVLKAEKYAKVYGKMAIDSNSKVRKDLLLHL